MQITIEGAARRGIVTPAYVLIAAGVEDLADVVLIRQTFGPKGLNFRTSSSTPKRHRTQFSAFLLTSSCACCTRPRCPTPRAVDTKVGFIAVEIAVCRSAGQDVIRG
jgi:hypothetical protein